jgi:hypothetical protein
MGHWGFAVAEIWKKTAADLLNLALGNPASPVQFGIVLVVMLVAFAVVLKIAAHVVRMPMADAGRAFMVTGFGALLVLAAAVAARLYAAPSLPQGALRDWAPLAAAVAALFALVVPLACFLHRGNYVQSAVAVALAVVAAGALVFLIHAWFGAASTGRREAKTIRKHKQDVERFMRLDPAPRREREPALPRNGRGVIV